MCFSVCVGVATSACITLPNKAKHFWRSLLCAYHHHIALHFGANTTNTLHTALAGKSSEWEQWQQQRNRFAVCGIWNVIRFCDVSSGTEAG